MPDEGDGGRNPGLYSGACTLGGELLFHQETFSEPLLCARATLGTGAPLSHKAHHPVWAMSKDGKVVSAAWVGGEGTHREVQDGVGVLP